MEEENVRNLCDHMLRGDSENNMCRTPDEILSLIERHQLSENFPASSAK